MTHGVEVPGPLRVDVAQSRPGAEDARLVTRVVRVKVSIRSINSQHNVVRTGHTSRRPADEMLCCGQT